MEETTLRSCQQTDRTDNSLLEIVLQYEDRAFSDVESLLKTPWLMSFLKEIGLCELKGRLLFEAISHTSFIHEKNAWPYADNERLEFLGDAALDLWISEQFYSRLKNLSEGQMSQLRGALVNESFLAEWSRLIDLPKLLLVGKGERALKEGQLKGIHSDLFEAVLGAAFLSGGYELVGSVLTRWTFLFEKEGRPLFSLARLDEFDPKTKLQERTMLEFSELPRYETVETEKGFFTKIIINGETLAEGSGHSKKKLEKKLALEILQEEKI